MTATSPSLETTASTPTTLSEQTPRRVTDGAGNPDCPHCHGLGYLRDDVPVGHPNFGKLAPCTCRLEQMQRQRAQLLRSESNTETLAGKTFDTYLPEGVSPDPAIRATVRAAYERCKAFAQHPDQWLLLTGSYGCGKTHLAAAIANYCLANGQPVLFLNTPDLLDYLRAAFAPDSDTTYTERFDEIRTMRLLVLDDLGTESPTHWATEKLYQLLNYRYNARLPTVVTTNKDLRDIDQRVASRLSDQELVSLLEVKAPDFRAGKIGETSDISTLLLHRAQTFDSFDNRSDLPSEARPTFLNAIRAAHEFAEQPQGWLVLAGPYGSGKTHLAAAVANERSQSGKPVIFVTYQDLSDLFRGTNNRETDERNARLVHQVKTTEFLVLDDLPNLTGSPGYYREKFFQVFNYRFDAQLPTVLTTAAEEKELDPRLKSRLFYSEVCQVHVLKATPYRGKKKTGRKK